LFFFCFVDCGGAFLLWFCRRRLFPHDPEFLEDVERARQHRAKVGAVDQAVAEIEQTLASFSVQDELNIRLSNVETASGSGGGIRRISFEPFPARRGFRFLSHDALKQVRSLHLEQLSFREFGIREDLPGRLYAADLPASEYCQTLVISFCQRAPARMLVV